jgi:hypothetical protein
MPGLVEMAQRKWTKVAPRSVWAVKFHIPNLTQAASRVVAQVNAYNSNVVFIDGIDWDVFGWRRLRNSWSDKHVYSAENTTFDCRICANAVTSGQHIIVTD